MKREIEKYFLQFLSLSDDSIHVRKGVVTQQKTYLVNGYCSDKFLHDVAVYDDDLSFSFTETLPRKRKKNDNRRLLSDRNETIRLNLG